MTKQDIRKLFKAKRNALSQAKKDRLEDLMLIQFQTLPIEIPKHILSYAPVEKQNEFNPFLVEEYCYFKNPSLQISLPVADFINNTITAFIVNEDTDFVTNNYGIVEPIHATELPFAKIEMVIVPLLAFSEIGYRVGYGKGFYDKFLKNCLPTTLKIGFSFFEPIDIDDVFILDEKLDYCITPNRIYQF